MVYKAARAQASSTDPDAHPDPPASLPPFYLRQAAWRLLGRRSNMAAALPFWRRRARVLDGGLRGPWCGPACRILKGSLLRKCFFLLQELGPLLLTFSVVS